MDSEERDARESLKEKIDRGVRSHLSELRAPAMGEFVDLRGVVVSVDACTCGSRRRMCAATCGLLSIVRRSPAHRPVGRQ
jgi:hypothetical protein